ncbi:MAG TPA: redoxin domain-containing protein [Candidatus Saccharicenans sp.]|jgi:thiol-disulfide isomerase/thioredoxin|nr:redoxin domain-containing protein [Candidatus Saccharicenans sp.]HRD02908.1 redoxin domain-containing protein [Candidatus Saccharicenans sp.]
MKRLKAALLKSWWLALPLLVLSSWWGYKNYYRFEQCQAINQTLMNELKKASGQIRAQKSFLEEGDWLNTPLSLSLLDGQEVKLKPDETYLLIFISTGCPACLEIALDVYGEVDRYEEKGLRIISISRNLVEELADMASARNWPMVVAHDTTGQLHRLFQIDGLPSVILIRQGAIGIKANALSIDRKLPDLKEMIAETFEDRAT